LRQGFANTQKLSPYETFNVNLSRRIQITPKTAVNIRFDVVNILDKIYELRSGSGIGVFAPQFGQRRGFYGTVAYDF
jgi:outer membrane receptor protein involved in Fe transport